MEIRKILHIESKIYISRFKKIYFFRNGRLLALCKYSPLFYSLLKARAYQPTAGLTFTYPRTEVKEHIVSVTIAVTCGQHVNLCSCYWI